MNLSGFILFSLMLFAYAIFGFGLSRYLKRNDIADVLWGPGFIWATLSTLMLNPRWTLSILILTFVLVLWAVRLFLHIGLRNRQKSEDFRYAAWRRAWGRWFWIRSFFQVYLFQVFLIACVGSPILFFVVDSQLSFSILHGPGLFLMLIGLYIESLADFQLTSFKKNPLNKDRLIMSGLWKHSRHPNYLGEILFWWGVGLYTVFDIGVLKASVGPLLITFLITQISGVPLLEAKYKTHPDFEEYKKTTPMLIPRLSSLRFWPF